MLIADNTLKFTVNDYVTAAEAFAGFSEYHPADSEDRKRFIQMAQLILDYLFTEMVDMSEGEQE